MIDKLQELILHFEDLEKQMIAPNLINDQNKYKEGVGCICKHFDDNC